jgi:hypothetical protein
MVCEPLCMIRTAPIGDSELSASHGVAGMHLFLGFWSSLSGPFKRVDSDRRFTPLQLLFGHQWRQAGLVWLYGRWLQRKADCRF